MNADALALEIVSLFKEVGNVREIDNAWGKRFNYASLLYNAEFEIGFFKKLNYRCRVSLGNTELLKTFSAEGKLVIESRDEMLKHWQMEAQKIAPHFMVVKEYEDDPDIRRLNGDYNFYLEAFTVTSLNFAYLSFSKAEKIARIIEVKIKENAPKGTIFVDEFNDGLVGCMSFPERKFD